nr:hypothetical protein [Candidatus Woesearchaeota archaeon]
MGLAYDRVEERGKIKIIYSRGPYFIWSSIILFILGFLDAIVASFLGFTNISGLFFLFAMIIAATYGLSSAIVSVKINMKSKDGGVKVTGSMFSFKNPQIFEYKR